MKKRPQGLWQRMGKIVKENADAIGQCETFLLIYSKNIAEEIVPVVQMGIAVYEDKPVLILAPESKRGMVNTNLQRLALAIEYYDDDAEDVAMEMQAATMRMMEKAGMVK